MSRNPKLRGFDVPSYTLLAGVEQQILYVPEHILLQIPWMTDAIKAHFITPTQPIKLPQYNPEALATVFHILQEGQIQPIKQIHEHVIPTVERTVARTYFAAYLASCRLSLCKAEQLLLFQFGRYMDLAPAEEARMLFILEKEGLQKCRLYNLLDYRLSDSIKIPQHIPAYLATRPGLNASTHAAETMTRLAEQFEKISIPPKKYGTGQSKQAPPKPKSARPYPEIKAALPHSAVPARNPAHPPTKGVEKISPRQAVTDLIPLSSLTDRAWAGTLETSPNSTRAELLDESPNGTSSLSSLIDQTISEDQRVTRYLFNDGYEDPNVEWWADDLFHDSDCA